MSNHIENLQDELAAANAESMSLRDGLTNLMAYLTSDKFATDNSVNVNDVLLRASETLMAARDDRDAALLNERGPKPVASVKGWACPICLLNERGPMPVASVKGWACPICREPLQDEIIWNDTEAKAERRMRDHWTANHKQR